jgi:hypothetical protein
MKSVREIYIDALALKRQQLPLHEITYRLIDIAHANGFSHITERGGMNAVELQFANGEIIHFDGDDWHHVRP